MKSKTFKIPLYFGTVTIVKCSDLVKVVKKYDLDFNPFGYEAMVFRNSDKSGYDKYVIAFDVYPTPKIIAHECLHFVNHVFEDRGIEHDVNNDEPAAYLLGWIVEQCHKFFKENEH